MYIVHVYNEEVVIWQCFTRKLIKLTLINCKKEDFFSFEYVPLQLIRIRNMTDVEKSYDYKTIKKSIPLLYTLAVKMYIPCVPLKTYLFFNSIQGYNTQFVGKNQFIIFAKLKSIVKFIVKILEKKQKNSETRGEK